MTFEQWLSDWRKNHTTVRLGQHFCNQFIRNVWSELYHETDDAVAKTLIIEWLKATQHWPNVPHK